MLKKVPTLRGKTVINLFYESSTRTSFEIAAKRMSAGTINISASTSGTTKGETLADTARNLEAMKPDAIVVRHPASGRAACWRGTSPVRSSTPATAATSARRRRCSTA